MTIYKRARERADYKGSPHDLLEKLSAIRLSTFIESPPQNITRDQEVPQIQGLKIGP